MNLSELEKIALLRINKDAEFAIGFIKHGSEMDEQAYVLCMYNLYGLFAMIAYEGANYCLQHSIHTNVLSDTLKEARHRVKLYEHTGMGISGTSSYMLDTLLPAHENYMRKGLKLPAITKYLQKDTGITYVNNLPVFTTLAASFDAGMGDDAEKLFNGEFIKETATELGRELAILNGGNTARDVAACFVLDAKNITEKDVFARSLYGSRFNGKGTPALNSSLYMMQCRQNFIETCLAGCNQDETLLKYKYVSAHTTLKGLEHLRSETTQQELTAESVAVIDSILALPFAVTILSTRGRQFRNIMVHNDIRGGFTERDIMPSKKFYGLVEYFFSGMSSDNLGDEIDKLSSALAQHLNTWS